MSNRETPALASNEDTAGAVTPQAAPRCFRSAVLSGRTPLLSAQHRASDVRPSSAQSRQRLVEQQRGHHEPMTSERIQIQHRP